MSPFPSFENLVTPSSPIRPNASPYLRTTSSRTTTTTTTTRTHIRGHSLSMPTSPPQRAADAIEKQSERARTKSGFSSGATSRGARSASVRSWHSDEEDEDDDEEDSYARPRRDRVASETPLGMDANSRGGSGSLRRQTTSLRSSPAQQRGDLPFQSSSSSFNKSARVTSFQTPPSPPSRSFPRRGRTTLHRARSSSSSTAGLSAFDFAFPSLFPSQGPDDFDNISTPSPTPAVGGERRRKTTKSAPSSRVNLAAMFKAAGSDADSRRASAEKGGGIFGLVKDGIQALQHHHQQASTASSHSSSGINLSPIAPFASGSHRPSSSSTLLSPRSAISPSRPNSPSPGDSEALTILTRPIYPIAKFATLICISFFALLALSSVLVGSYGLTAWDEGRLRIAGARERVEGGRRMIERGVERAREVVGEVMSGGVDSEDTAGDGAGWSREERGAASGEERRRHEGSGGRRSDKRTTEEAFKQLHEAAVTVVRRVLPSSITGLLFNASSPSTRSRKRSAPHSHPPSSSKRHSRKTSTDETIPRTAPYSRQSSRRPSFSAPFSPSSNNSGDEREDASTRPRRSSTRTLSPSPTRRGSGHSENRYTFSNPGSPSNSTQEPFPEKHSSSSSAGKKRGGGSGGSTNGLPPRPPLGVLIPSIFLTIVIAVCALVGGFIKGWQGRGNKARR